jgi:hypothetical protein
MLEYTHSNASMSNLPAVWIVGYEDKNRDGIWHWWEMGDYNILYGRSMEG